MRPRPLGLNVSGCLTFRDRLAAVSREASIARVQQNGSQGSRPIGEWNAIIVQTIDWRPEHRAHARGRLGGGRADRPSSAQEAACDGAAATRHRAPRAGGRIAHQHISAAGVRESLFQRYSRCRPDQSFAARFALWAVADAILQFDGAVVSLLSDRPTPLDQRELSPSSKAASRRRESSSMSGCYYR
jgi:hypothetical protein